MIENSEYAQLDEMYQELLRKPGEGLSAYHDYHEGQLECMRADISHLKLALAALIGYLELRHSEFDYKEFRELL